MLGRARGPGRPRAAFWSRTRPTHRLVARAAPASYAAKQPGSGKVSEGPPRELAGDPARGRELPAPDATGLGHAARPRLDGHRIVGLVWLGALALVAWGL